MRNRRFVVAVWLASAAAVWLFSITSRLAADSGAVEGAIWRYQMTRVAGKGVTRQGRFRISGTEIFQRRMDGSEVVVGRIDGKFERPKWEVFVTFDSLRGSDMQELAAKGKLKNPNAFGKAEGRLIDSNGFHWNFRAERIRE